MMGSPESEIQALARVRRKEIRIKHLIFRDS